MCPSPVLLKCSFLTLSLFCVWFPFVPQEGPKEGKGEAPSSLGVPLNCHLFLRIAALWPELEEHLSFPS